MHISADGNIFIVVEVVVVVVGMTLELLHLVIICG